jgi:hypothetical protein
MASAELLKGVEGEIRDVRRDAHGVDSKVQAIGDQLDQVNRPLSLQLCSTFLGSNLFTGNHLRDQVLRWLSPPVPSTSHSIPRNVHHNGTAQWFFHGNMYGQWKSSGDFLWVRGKRAFLFVFSMQRPPTIRYIYSRFREKCPLVCPSLTHSALPELILSIQFLNYTRYHVPARCWDGLDGLFLF